MWKWNPGVKALQKAQDNIQEAINKKSMLKNAAQYATAIKGSTLGFTPGQTQALSGLLSAIGGGGGGQPLPGIVTSQYDFNPSRGRKRRRYSSVRGIAKSRKIPKRLKRKLIRRIKKKRSFRRAVKRISRQPKFKTCFVHSYGRSWAASAVNTTSVAYLPFISLFGTQITTASTANAVAGVGYYSGRLDDLQLLRQYYDGATWRGTGAATNQRLNDYWFKITHLHLDVTLNNTGSVGDTVSGATTSHALEYEVYFIRFKRKHMRTNPATVQNTIPNIITSAQEQRNPLGDTTNAVYTQDCSDPAYLPYIHAYIGKYYRAKLLGRGVIGVGQHVRFNKTLKLKKSHFWTKMKLDKYVTDLGETDMGLLESRGLLITYRGLPSSGEVQGLYRRARLTVLVNKYIYAYTRNSQPGQDTVFLTANDFA